MEIIAKEHNVTILDHHSGKLTRKTIQDPITIPASISNGWKPGHVDDQLPDTFCGKVFIFINRVMTNLFKFRGGSRGREGVRSFETIVS